MSKKPTYEELNKKINTLEELIDAQKKHDEINAATKKATDEAIAKAQKGVTGLDAGAAAEWLKLIKHKILSQMDWFYLRMLRHKFIDN